MQVLKERTTIAKKVETGKVNKVPVMESIVDEESLLGIWTRLYTSLQSLFLSLLNLKPSRGLHFSYRLTTSWKRTVSRLLGTRASWTLVFVQLRVT